MGPGTDPELLGWGWPGTCGMSLAANTPGTSQRCKWGAPNLSLPATLAALQVPGATPFTPEAFLLPGPGSHRRGESNLPSRLGTRWPRRTSGPRRGAEGSVPAAGHLPGGTRPLVAGAAGGWCPGPGLQHPGGERLCRGSEAAARKRQVGGSYFWRSPPPGSGLQAERARHLGRGTAGAAHPARSASLGRDAPARRLRGSCLPAAGKFRTWGLGLVCWVFFVVVVLGFFFFLPLSYRG